MTTEQSAVEVTAEDEALAAKCVPAAMIFADNEEHIADARRRAAIHIATARLASNIPALVAEESRRIAMQIETASFRTDSATPPHEIWTHGFETAREVFAAIIRAERVI